MKKVLLFILISSFLVCGCSLPTATTYEHIYSLSRQEKKVKVGMSKKKTVLIKDFRENEMYEEDYTALKDAIEKYIARHPDLSETQKNNLRELKVIEDQTKEEVELLLGEADKISRSGNGRAETWIYRINRWRAFTLFIIPVFFSQEGYYLRFKDNQLSRIERRHPGKIVHQAPAPGLSPETSGHKK